METALVSPEPRTREATCRSSSESADRLWAMLGWQLDVWLELVLDLVGLESVDERRQWIELAVRDGQQYIKPSFPDVAVRVLD